MIDNSKKTIPKQRILVVDPNGQNIVGLQDSLRTAGYRVIGSENGKMGFLLAKTFKPQLVLSEVLMPVMNGIDLCRKIRREHSLNQIRFVLLTDIRSDEVIFDAFRAGIDDFLFRPNMPANILVPLVSNLLARPREAADLNTGSAGFQINLEDVGLTEAFDLIASSNKEAIVRILHDNISGTVFVRDGKIIQVELRENEDHFYEEAALKRICRIQAGKIIVNVIEESKRVTRPEKILNGLKAIYEPKLGRPKTSSSLDIDMTREIIEWEIIHEILKEIEVGDRITVTRVAYGGEEADVFAGKLTHKDRDSFTLRTSGEQGVREVEFHKKNNDVMEIVIM